MCHQRVFINKRVIHIHDVLTEPNILHKENNGISWWVKQINYLKALLYKLHDSYCPY